MPIGSHPIDRCIRFGSSTRGTICQTRRAGWITRSLQATALGVLLLLLACGDDSTPTEVAVDDVEVEPVVYSQSYSGTLALGSTSCHEFEVLETGDVTITLTALEPLETLTVGMGIGLDDDTLELGCSLFAVDDSVKLSESFLSSSRSPGAYCFCVYDVGNIFPDTTVSYSAQVDHT